MNLFISAAGSLWRREAVRFLRQPNRIVGALGTPLVFWFLIGSGLGRSFQGAGGTYLHYFFPGAVALTLLFTAVFSTISIIEDRREGFLQGVLVSPAPRAALVAGKLLGGATLATGQGAVFLVLLPFLKIPLPWGALPGLLLFMALLSFGMTGLGFLLAWRMDSTHGFHAVMNLFLMPMWFLSGALFPAGGAPGWLRAVMAANPLTYGVGYLHGVLFPSTAAPAPGLCWAVTAAFAALTAGLSLWAVRAERA